MSQLKTIYRQVLAPMVPSYIAGAFAAGMLWGNPVGTPFQTMPVAEQVASVGFVTVLLANLAFVLVADNGGGD